MDFQRAHRNLQLIYENEDEGDQNGSLGTLETPDIAGTQVPGTITSSSCLSATNSYQNDGIMEEQVFINTQIQSRLDDDEHDSMQKSMLGRFKYSNEDDVAGLKIQSKKKPTVSNKKKSKVAKSAVQPSVENYQQSKAEGLLKLLSGKHKKVKDMLHFQQQMDKSSGKRKNGKRAKVQYDTYNAEEWQYTFKLLLDRFPHSEPNDVKQVYHYLYGEGQETQNENLWTASQLAPGLDPESAKLTNLPLTARESQKITLLSLSQVMNDKSGIESDDEEQAIEPKQEMGTLLEEIRIDRKGPHPQTAQPKDSARGVEDKIDVPKEQNQYHHDEDTDDASTIPDSTDENSTIIPLGDALDRETGAQSTQFYTPSTSPPDGIIDLTQASFKVVRSLISPLKRADTALIQVPATRTSTISCHGKLPSSESYIKANLIRLKLRKSQLPLNVNKSSEEFTIHTHEPSESNPIILDTEAEDNDFQSFCMIDLELNDSPTKIAKENLTITNSLESQSLQELRQSIKTIGLKPSRSKSKMLASLDAASQLLDNATNEQQKRQEIYDHLTSIAQSCPSLLEKIYTFQPISIDDLLSPLIDVNSFVDKIDESTIREWADIQGICLRNS